MRIGELAQATDCQVVTIRYYERAGVLPPPARSANNYRVYDRAHLQRLRFVRRTRELGFSLDEVRTLLGLVDGGDYTCDDMRRVAQGHLEEVRARLQDLRRMEATLAELVGRCTGGATPDCSMLEALFRGRSRSAMPRAPRRVGLTQAPSG
ncbi:MAG: helix-turn-helix domain-containing protein [Halofilum sp. (in: g-proteobacteria)]|nr:helix-turn-helix domain-containing protein [Halofilum sp. (in: g-proteobacteria)]